MQYYVHTLFMSCQFIFKYIPISKPHMYHYILYKIMYIASFLVQKVVRFHLPAILGLFYNVGLKLSKAEESSLVLSGVEMLCNTN